MRQRSNRVFIVFILMPFCQLVAQSRMPAEMASLHPVPGLTWQRVRPAQTADGALEGPVLYQLLLNASGTPGTVPVFDTNPRHLANSPITVSGGNIVIGGNNGLIINGGNGLVTFNSGQVFPGTTGVNSVTAGDSFITIGGTPLNPTVGLNTANTDQRYLQLSGGVMTGNITFANSQTFPQVTLAGEVTGPASANVVSDAVSTNTANAIVRRDGSGDFSADTINLGGILALPNTASASIGVLTLGGTPFLHNFGTNNTFVGTSAGNLGLTGIENTAVGNLALSSVTTGYNNSAFGYLALATNKTGGFNTAFGSGALNSVTGDGNSAFGAGALVSTTGVTGVYNSAFGLTALGQNTTGAGNTAVGAFALEGPPFTTSSGSGNVAVGRGALGLLESGDFNTAIGANAGSSLNPSGSNNIFINNTGVAGDSGMIRVGTSGTQTATFIAGINGVTVASGTEVFINSSGQLGTVTSSRRFKQDIADLGTESDILMKLHPVAFYYRPELDSTHTRQYGLVAEEVAQIAPGLVVFDQDGQPQTVRYHFINAMLLNEVQKQRQFIEQQQRENEAQQKEIDLLKEEIEKQQAAQQAQIAQLSSQMSAIQVVLKANHRSKGELRIANTGRKTMRQ